MIEVKTEHDKGPEGDGRLSIDDFRQYRARLIDAQVDPALALKLTRSSMRLYYPGSVRAGRIAYMAGSGKNPDAVKAAEHTLDQYIEVAVRGAIQPVSGAQKRE